MRATALRSMWACASLALISLSARAQQCPDIAPYQKPRETIQDLNRIVAPSGIQESYKTRIGGIEQWINVRGQDQANPITRATTKGSASSTDYNKRRRTATRQP